jgi:putative transposase
MTAVVQERPEGLPLAMACRALGLNRSSVYARQQASCLAEAERAERRSRRACVQPRALTPEERQAARAALYSPEYRDQPPAEVHAALLAQGQYLGSLSTFHRILRADAAQGERRLQRPPQQHAIPRLCATAPHQVWTWDSSKLANLRRGVYLSL